jgi:hypothetical protein
MKKGALHPEHRVSRGTNMKRISYMVSILLITVCTFGVGHCDTSEQDQLLLSYIQYLQNGDTQGLLSILGDPLMNRKKDQLQSNPSYSSFLAKHYENANFQVSAVKRVDAYTSKGGIDIVFPGSAKPLEIKLLLKRIDGLWKIVDE